MKILQLREVWLDVGNSKLTKLNDDYWQKSIADAEYISGANKSTLRHSRLLAARDRSQF